MLGTGLAGLVIKHHIGDAAKTHTPVAVAVAKPEPIRFSARELEILARIAAGSTSVEIAERLHISVHTVKNHRKNILRKAGCRNCGQLITRCTALGLV